MYSFTMAYLKRGRQCHAQVRSLAESSPSCSMSYNKRTKKTAVIILVKMLKGGPHHLMLVLMAQITLHLIMGSQKEYCLQAQIQKQAPLMRIIQKIGRIWVKK